MLTMIAACVAMGQFAQNTFIQVQTGTPTQELVNTIPMTDLAQDYIEIILRAEAATTSLQTIRDDSEYFGGTIALECINGKPQGVQM